MDMNKCNASFNPQKCERYLSEFGKKVLHELLKQWNTARDQKSNNNHYRQYSQTKKILNFTDNNIQNTPAFTNTHLPPVQIYTEEEVLNLNITDTAEPEVPTSKDLTKTLEIDVSTKKDAFEHLTVVSSNIVHEQSLAQRDEIQGLIFKKPKSIFENISSYQNNVTDVNWDNMFDTDLLNDRTNNIINEQNKINNEQNEITYNKDINSEKIKKGTGKRKNSSNDNPKTNKKAKIAVKKATKSNNDAPKPTFRKQKYTKIVKTWLNDVESYDPDKERVVTSDFNDEYNDINAKIVAEVQENNNNMTIAQSILTINKPQITINKSVKANKKVVQAQLANKDGVMKFSKPKKIDAETTIVDINLSKEKKDKGAKKFIPPIKSQIPVQNITYNIITIDDTNAEECCEALLNEEVLFAVIIFSNGFCQLNSNFTDGTSTCDGIFIGTGDLFYYFKSPGQKIKQALAQILISNKIVISYEAGIVLIYLTTHFQMDINAIHMYDIKIGASLLDPDNPPENFSDLQMLLSFTPTYTIATECTLQKTAWYMTLLKECWSRLNSMLIENQLWQVFVEIEMKLLPIIAEMERLGVSIDESKLKSMEEVLMTRMKLIEQECYKAAGKVFQINSTVQVRSIIYDELQLDAKCNVEIRETLAGGLKSTSETMLRSLMSVHPLPKLILEYRHLHKAHATFLAGIATQVKDGVVRPTWVQTAAATGRIASNNPNLQAIPKTPFSLVMFPDNDATDLQYLNFRSVYVSRAGCSFVAADFKHVECRVFAHASADTGLLKSLTHSDDLFRVLAAQWLNKSEELVTAAERDRTKRLVYASLYGAGTRKLMEILDVSYEQALQVTASFNRTFPSLKSFGRHVVSQCSQAGGRLSTLCGRVRHFANITSEDFNLKSHAERQAVNFVIQGSAADLCKTAMILTEAEFRQSSPPVEAHLVLQIHDELVWEVEDQQVDMAAGIIKQVMEGCGQHCGMSMTLPVAITVGKRWGEMEDYPSH